MKKTLFIFTAVAAAVLSGCTPAPQACFDKTATVVDVNQVVTFTNCSVDFSRSTWNFGDGATSTDANTTHSWATQGDFLVSLTVEDKNGTQTDNISDIVRVGKRFLTTIEMKSIDADNGGTPWDASDAPDVKLRMGKVSDHVDLYASAENTDLGMPLPHTINASALNVELTINPWYFFLEDVDGATSDTIGYWELDLATQGNGSSFSLTSGSTEIVVHYAVQ